MTDGLASYPGAVKQALGDEVEHQVRGCQANPIEQSHRRVKRRYYSTLGFAKLETAQSFCQTVDEIAQLFRPRRPMTEVVSLSKHRQLFRERVDELRPLFRAA